MPFLGHFALIRRLFGNIICSIHCFVELQKKDVSKRCVREANFFTIDINNVNISRP